MGDPGWTTYEDVQPFDEVAPESMASTVYSRRWVRDRGDGFHGVVTIKFYCEDRWQQAGAKDADEPGWADGGPEERYCLGQQVELVVCSDPDEVGDGGRWNELRYRSSDERFPMPMPDELIAPMMRDYAAHNITWDAVEIYGSDRSDIVDLLVEPITPEHWLGLMPYEVKLWIASAS